MYICNHSTRAMPAKDKASAAREMTMLRPAPSVDPLPLDEPPDEDEDEVEEVLFPLADSVTVEGIVPSELAPHA